MTDEETPDGRKPVWGCSIFIWLNGARSLLSTPFCTTGERRTRRGWSLSWGNIGLQHIYSGLSTELAQFLGRYATDDTNINNACTCASNVLSHKHQIYQIIPEACRRYFNCVRLCPMLSTNVRHREGSRSPLDWASSPCHAQPKTFYTRFVENNQVGMRT